MFTPKEVPKSQRMLESELERTISTMRMSPIDSEEYAKTLTVVERLDGMIDKDRTSSVSKDTLVVVAANLLGIAMIILYEGAGPNLIRSKALGFVTRPR